MCTVSEITIKDEAPNDIRTDAEKEAASGDDNVKGHAVYPFTWGPVTL
jgi:hypothetical protein